MSSLAVGSHVCTQGRGSAASGDPDEPSWQLLAATVADPVSRHRVSVFCGGDGQRAWECSLDKNALTVLATAAG